MHFECDSDINDDDDDDDDDDNNNNKKATHHTTPCTIPCTIKTLAARMPDSVRTCHQR